MYSHRIHLHNDPHTGESFRADLTYQDGLVEYMVVAVSGSVERVLESGVAPGSTNEVSGWLRRRWHDRTGHV